MRSVFALFLWIFPSLTFAITVSQVQVSVTADSAAVAREQALEEAHSLAFKKLLQENFPEVPLKLPPQDTLLNIVQGFSIDQEKTTPKSYRASLTFQFDEAQVQRWIEEGESGPSHTLTEQTSFGDFQTFPIKASYTGLSQWNHIKDVLSQAPGVKNLTVESLAPQEAILTFSYGKDLQTLRQYLLHKGFLLSPDENGWMLSPNVP